MSVFRVINTVQVVVFGLTLVMLMMLLSYISEVRHEVESNTDKCVRLLQHETNQKGKR